MPDSSSIDVSVILVNYNGQKHLEYCLPALMKTSGPSFEVIVVDNNSQDGSKDWLKLHYPEIQLIELDDNMGFGYANAKGIEVARSEFVSLLNTDTEVTPDWLASLYNLMKDHEDIAAACSELRLRAQPQIINAHGGGMTWIGIGYDKKMGRPAAGEANTECTECLFPTAAAMLMRRSAFNAVGGFDPEFFMYHEDVDLGWRFWIGGYRVIYCPQSLVYHQFGGTTGTSQSANFSLKMGLRHCLRALIKNYSSPRAVMAVSFFSFTLLIKGYKHLLIPTWRWNFQHWKSTMAARKSVQNMRKTSDCTISEKKLIDFPLPFPRQVQTVVPGRYWPAVSEFMVNHFLDFTKGSSDARLGTGWSPRSKKEGSRHLLGQALCTMRVEPDNHGKLKLRLYKPTGCSKITLSVNQGEPIELDAVHGWSDCSLKSVIAGQDGGLKLALAAEGAHPSVQSIRFVPEKMDEQEKSFSVVIPTYTRLDCLKIVLDALEKQELLPVDVVVVDDGSKDDTWAFLQQWAKGSGNFKRLIFQQENSGPAKARNLGIAHAAGDYVAIIGDDTIPRPDFLAVHRKAHLEQGPGNAIVGYTAWDAKTMNVTPFMDFINHHGAQFGYGLIPPHTEATYHFFYTSNISLARQALLDYRFDEAFRHAGWEDTELGFRLNHAGQRIVYYPEAITAHRHKHDVNTFTKRQQFVGQLTRVFDDKSPALKAAMVPQLTLINRAFLTFGKPFEWFQPMVHKLDQRNIKIPRIFFHAYLRYFFLKGLFGSK